MNVFEEVTKQLKLVTSKQTMLAEQCFVDTAKWTNSVARASEQTSNNKIDIACIVFIIL